MRKTSVYQLLIVLYWFIMLQALLPAQQMPQVEHYQGMHQRLVKQAHKLLEREAPGSAAKLRNRIGTGDVGSRPWERETLLCGVWREDEEDIVYGHGGTDDRYLPGINASAPFSSTIIRDGLISYATEDEGIRKGYVSVSHFWEPGANLVLHKSGMKISKYLLPGVTLEDEFSFWITPSGNAWDKIQRMLRPNGQIAIRDYWWLEGDQMFDQYGTPVVTLPQRNHEIDAVQIRYNTLVELYNTGHCTIQLPGQYSMIAVVLTKAQRDRYVWEIFGRALHLLGDMSVPAHTHKDLHMGNWNEDRSWNRISYRLVIEDAESYESWIGSEVNQWWTAERISDGLVPLTGVADPIEYLMSTMRAKAASFASDDVNGSGVLQLSPIAFTEIPNRHNLPNTYNAQKSAMMMTIRDNTIPYAIRATATLMKWFVDQLDMPQSYRVWNLGAPGFTDFFRRTDYSQQFPQTGTPSATLLTQQAGDVLSLRPHIEVHPSTQSKFKGWSSYKRGDNVRNQVDEYVVENQQDVECWYERSQVHQLPRFGTHDEYGVSTSLVPPLFKNPWHVNPALSDGWNLHQPDAFEEFNGAPAANANGGLFYTFYDPMAPPNDYYSIRASKNIDGNSRKHKSTPLEAGDFAFVEWETMFANLFPDPKNYASPPIPAYANAEEYDTKIVDFTDRNAVVNAHYKAHRTSDRVQPPTNVNSQRKVARDARGFYHAVYESGGRIWYVRSTDRGVSWSNEERVSDIAAAAARPSIAAMSSVAWITYVQDGQVVVRIRGNKGWETLYSAPVTMKDECTPAIAVLDDYSGAVGRGAAICLVWEDRYEIRFTMIQQGRAILDNQLLAAGHTNPGGIDQPRYPSVAASTMTPSVTAMDHGFHFAWIENGSIYYANLAVERRTDPITIWGWQPRGAYTVETVHARTGSVGLAYPARHAPSVAVTTQGVVHVAFDVTNWYSAWPVNSAGVGTPGSPTGTVPNSMFAVCERSLAMLHTPVWLTTTTLIGGSSNSTLCSPSVAVKPPMLGAGTKSNALRVLYNDRFGQLRVARFEGGLTLDFHAEGWDPSVTDYAPTVDGLVDVYSYTAQQPYTWHLLSSQNNLAKTSNDNLLRMRQLLLSHDESVAALGISMPRLRAGEEIRPIEWNEAHDSLVIGLNTTVQEKMRTAVFTPNNGEKLLLDVERFGVNITDTQSEILLRINDAKNGEALRVISMPLNAFASASAMAVQEFDLSGVSGTAVFISADVYTPGEKWSAAVVDRYAIADETQDAGLEKSPEAAAPGRPVLKQNHPNPFNPSTSINYHLPEAGKVRIAVYNLLGQEVVLLKDGWVSAGDHSLQFDGTSLPSGVYLYRLESAGATFTRSMHLVK